MPPNTGGGHFLDLKMKFETLFDFLHFSKKKSKAVFFILKLNNFRICFRRACIFEKTFQSVNF